MDNLLNTLQIANKICKDANVHFERAYDYENEILMLQRKLKKRRIIWLLIFLYAGWAVWVIASLIFKYPLVVFLVVIAFTILCIKGYIKDEGKTKQKIEDARENAQQEQKRGYVIFEENIEHLNFLSSDYWYPLATEYLVKMISGQRAATLAEALDKYDEQLHRWKVEEANAKILAQQQKQTEHLKSIRTSSNISAAANVANATFNIVSKL